MKRTLSLLLASLLVLSACGSDTPEAVETTKMGGVPPLPTQKKML